MNGKRLIDTEQAKRATYEEIFWTESEQAAVRNFLARLPTVDAVEVVRCKECKHTGNYNRVLTCPYYDDYAVEENHFCAYGERKDNG